jgi:integrase
MHGVLRHARSDAFRLGLVHRNVCDLVDMPRVRRRNITPLTADQVRTLLTAVQGHRSEALYVLALATGMRRGELLALRWQQVNLDNALVKVEESLQLRHGRWVVAQPKTKYSRRTIPLARTTVETLREHRMLLAQERLRLGPAWGEAELVFPPILWVRCRTRPTLRNSSSSRFCGRLVCRLFGSMTCANTAATLLLARGVNRKVVSEMLGHSSIVLTLGIYGHVMPHMQQQAAELIDRLMWGSQTG